MANGVLKEEQNGQSVMEGKCKLQEQLRTRVPY